MRSGPINDIATPEGIPVAKDVFTTGPQPCLIGGRHRESGRVVFPYPTGDARYDAIDLPRRGKVWSWTIQRFRPKSPPYIGPEAFEPFAIGYVELPDAVIVETRLTGIAFDAIRIGMDVETVLLPFATDAAGRAVLTYAFAPVREDADHG